MKVGMPLPFRRGGPRGASPSSAEISVFYSMSYRGIARNPARLRAELGLLAITSQGLQEGNQGFPILRAQFSKASSGLTCFAFVAHDCIVQRERSQVVHKAGFFAQAPQGRRP